MQYYGNDKGMAGTGFIGQLVDQGAHRTEGPPMGSAQDSVIAYWNQPECVEESDLPYRSGFDRPRYESVWRGELQRRLPDPPAEVLDLGAGTGFLSLLLAELGHRVRGVDLADNALSRARRQAAARGLDIVFEVGDAQAPPGRPASVDAVTSRYLFWTLSDPAALLAASARLLRPGGTLIIFDGVWFPHGVDPASCHDLHWYDDWIARYSPPVRRHLPLLEHNDSGEVARLVAGAGFVDVRTTRLEHVERLVADAGPDASERYVVWARKPPARSR